MRNRADRRRLTRAKIERRRKLMKAYGQQGGTVYEKHRDKIDRSAGYLRDGNVTHYVAVGFRQKTRDRNRYGKVRFLSRRDRVSEEKQLQQMREENRLQSET